MTAPAQHRTPGAAEAVIEIARPLVIAHRGFSTAAPENTLPAFELALAAGADLVELDVHRSADGVWVVIHDATLDRTTDAVSRRGRRRLAVRDVSWEELCALDAGSWFQPRYAGTRVPSLTEAVRLIRTGGCIPLIERKAGEPADLVRLLRELNVAREVVVQSFDWHFLRLVHEEAPEITLAALGPPSRLPDGSRGDQTDPSLDDARARRAEPTGARVLVWDHYHIHAAGVRAAQKRGFKVWVYTVNADPDYERVLVAGVNGLITDQPARLWRFLALRKGPNATPGP